MKIGTNVLTKKEFVVKDAELLKSHAFVTGITRSGKTNLILKLIEVTRSEEYKKIYGEVPIVIFDIDGEYLNVPKIQNDFVLFENEGKYAEIFNIQNAKAFGEVVRKDLISIVIKLQDFATRDERERYVKEFLQGFRIQDRQYWHPALILIDEADLFVPTVSKKKNSISREEIIEVGKRGLKEGISLFCATQTASSVHIDLRRQCHNRIIGSQVEDSDRNTACRMLGDRSLYDPIYDLQTGQFYVRGTAFASLPTLIQVDKSGIDTPTIGIKTETTQNEVVQEYVVNRVEGDTRSLIQTYEEKIRKLEDENKILHTNQWTQSKQQSAYDEGQFDGRLKTQEEFKKKSLVDRVLNK